MILTTYSFMKNTKGAITWNGMYFMLKFCDPTARWGWGYLGLHEVLKEKFMKFSSREDFNEIQWKLDWKLHWKSRRKKFETTSFARE